MIDTTYKIIKNKILFYHGYNLFSIKIYTIHVLSRVCKYTRPTHIDRYTLHFYIYTMSINLNTTLYKCIKWYKIKWKSKVAH